ncbi:MAG: hypothetical protein Q9169_006543 [Polycauliona sp. 2 TL-2023]
MPQETIKRGPYTIARTPAPCFPVEQRPQRFLIVLTLAWLSWILYFGAEILLVCRLTHHRPRLWLAIAAEFALSFQELVLALGLLLGLISLRGQPPRPSLQLLGAVAPTVDVLITCCGEPIDVILDTVKAAAAQDYQPASFRILVLDDGHDDALRSSLIQLAPWLQHRNFASVSYLSRQVEKGSRSFFKAGNLQYGINAGSRASSPSEYCAGLDCDMLAESDWLRKCVAHMVLSDDVGMVVNPQKYYNVPPRDPLGQQADFSMYFTVQEVLNDSSKACMCTGTGYVARRKALESIGGWPLAESGEDYMCSALLSDAGWEIAYVKENLQYGLCPGSMRALLKQRMRWTDAGIEVHRNFGFYLGRSTLTASMDWSQRVVNILYMLRDYAPVAVLLALAMLPYQLLFGDDVLATSMLKPPQLDMASTSVRYLFIVSWTLNKVYQLLFYRHIGLSRVWYFQSNEIWAAPYMAYRCFLSSLPSRLKNASFAVCGTFPASERSSRYRPSFLSRLFNINTLLWICFTLYTSAPLISRYATRGSRETENGAMWLLPGPLLKLVGSILKMTVPVKYMLFPPSMPPRESILAADNMDVRRVKNSWKNSGENQREWGVWAFVAVIELTCYLIICSII